MQTIKTNAAIFLILTGLMMPVLSLFMVSDMATGMAFMMCGFFPVMLGLYFLDL